MKIFKNGGHRMFENDFETAKVVSEMLIDLEKNGMDAVRKYSAKFDGWSPDDFELSSAQVERMIASCDERLLRDTAYSQGNVRRFAEAQLATMHPLEVENQPGVILGHRHIPVGAVGSYIPGGRYPLFGSAQMSIIPAKVAGVKTVVACTPPAKEIGCYPATVNAMKTAGADRIFVIGGVPAFAMMAFGMGVVEPVNILCGAGNKYVAEAKRQLFGRCGIDLLAGPSEILVIADEAANPEVVACDILGQAEHDPNAGLCLICFSEAFAAQCLQEIDRQLAVLPTRDIAEQSWANYGIVYVAESPAEAVAISDDYAPEHLELLVADDAYYMENLKNYGSLFVGEETTVAYGDKTIGTNHILPTSCAAKYTGGVWVGKFLKTVTYQKITKKASVEIGRVVKRQCDVEMMPGHALTAEMRVRMYS